MSHMSKIDLSAATAIPPGLGPINLHTPIAGMGTKRGFFQQGDVLIRRLDTPFAGERGAAVSNLAVNADTGASHSVVGDARISKVLRNGVPVADLLLLEVGAAGATIVHAGGSDGHTHGSIPVEAGEYRVTGVVEVVNPFAAETRVLRAAD
jgi:hypothetical protein